MHKSLTPPHAIIALAIAAIIAIAPKPALASPNSIEQVAKAMFGEEMSHVTCDPMGEIQVSAGAQFQSGARVDLAGERVSLNIEPSMTAPSEPIILTGSGTLTFAKGTVSGGTLFRIEDGATLSFSFGTVDLSGIDVAGGTLDASYSGPASIGNITVSGSAPSTVTMTGGMQVTNLTLSSDSSDTQVTLSGALPDSLTTEETFEGTLSINGGITQNPVNLAGGNVEIASVVGMMVGMNVTGANVDLKAEFDAPFTNISGGSLKVSEGGSLGGTILLNNGLGKGSTLELAGGIVDGHLEMTEAGATLKFTQAPAPSGGPAITGTLDFAAGTIEMSASDGLLTSSPIDVPEGAAVNVTKRTGQVFTVSGGTMTIGSEGCSIDSISSGSITVTHGSGIKIGDVKGGTVALKSGQVDFTSETGNTGGAIIVSANGDPSVRDDLILNGTSLEVDGSLSFAGSNRSIVMKSGSITVNENGSIAGAMDRPAPTIEMPKGCTGTLTINGGTVTNTANRAILIQDGTVTLDNAGAIVGPIEMQGGTVTLLQGRCATSPYGQFKDAPVITQTGGTLTIGESATSAEATAQGPTIKGAVEITSGEANVLGGEIEGNLNVTPGENTKVIVGSPAESDVPASGPTITGTIPDTQLPNIIVYYVNGEAKYIPPEPEPEPEPTPPPAPRPTPERALATAAPAIKATMAAYANATYSDDFLTWDVGIEDESAPVSELARDLLAYLLRALSSSTVTSARYDGETSISVSLPTTQARRQAFAMDVLAAASGDADPDATLSSLYGKTASVIFTTSAGKELNLTVSFADAPATPPETVTVHRLYNPWLDGAHLFTTSTIEVGTLTKLGWIDEGPCFAGFANSEAESVAIIRLYNPNNGDHFFTEGEGEARALERDGWRREGVAWYAPATSELPAYRLYNPWQTEYEGLGNHLWTTSDYEASVLQKLGWLPEGTGWYALPLVAGR